MTRRRSTLAAVLAALLCVSIPAVASAIGEDEDPEVVYCQSLVALSASVDALSAIGTSSTVDEFETAVGDVRDAATTFEESLRALVEAQVETLEIAVGDLEGYRDSLAGDETIEEAVQGRGQRRRSPPWARPARTSGRSPTARSSLARRPSRRRPRSSLLS
jgi:hypothetical protein